MDLTNIISIALGFISVLLGLISIYIAIKISVKATSIEQKTDDRIIKDTIKETEDEDESDLNISDIQTAVNWIQSGGRIYDASYYYLLALKEYKNEYYSDAAINFQKAITQKNDQFPAAWFYLGHTYLKQSKAKGDELFNKAKDCFEKAKDLGHKYAARRLELMA